VVILAIFAPAISDSYEIHQNLAVAQPLSHAPEVRILVADHDRLSVIQNRIDTVDHESGYLQNAVEDEVPISANEAG
jgi:hypothetical protein